MSQPTTEKTQASLESFFKPAQPASRSATPSSQPARATFKALPANFPHPAFTGSREGSREPTIVAATGGLSAASSQQSYISSLSLHPSSPSDPYEIPQSPTKATVSNNAPGRVVKSSDDEDGDSESSLEDLLTVLQPKHSPNRPKTSSEFTPSTPTASRTKNVTFHTSPMPVLTKHNFDLKSLARHAEADRKTEASSKRIKAMQEASEKKGNMTTRGGHDASAKIKNSNILQDVVGGQEDGDVNKVARAVARTEATLKEQRWYFFDTQANPFKPQRMPFPTKSIPENWQNDFNDPKTRQQTFVSGFAEDMVSLGKALPDEILLWMLDEICVESDEPLRVSYCNVLKQSTEQVSYLINPNVIQKMLERVGAGPTSTRVTEKIRPVAALAEPYARRDWSKLRSLIKFFGMIAKSLQPRTWTVSIFLRMSMDKMVMDNVDIFDLVQETINRLCICVPDDAWENCCQMICSSLFNSVDQPTLRLQIVECTPSISPRTHDLKRRLAMSFYFNDLSYSTQHSHLLMDIDKFIDRLYDHDFDIKPETDFRELAALITLLNIAVDDGRSLNLNLKDPEIAKEFDKKIEEFSGAVKELMKGIGNPGAAFISRIEAKEAIELVSQRISDTLRSKPKAKVTVFDQKPEENLDGMKKGMTNFLSKGKPKETGYNSHV